MGSATDDGNNNDNNNPQMSADLEEAQAANMCCDSCGIAEVDDIKLKKCPACDLVKYCSDKKCQQDHMTEHERICMERAAEIRDEMLFRQPESTHLGDCPICFLPLPIDVNKSRMTSCCSKMICKGCAYANKMRELKENLQKKCLFCRLPLTTTEEEDRKIKMKRIGKNDPVALRGMGKTHCREGDYEIAIEYWTKAAALGDLEAHFCLGVFYHDGDHVEKDEKKGVYHLEEATIGGHPIARFYLALREGTHDRIERAVKHLIIAANLGDDFSVKELKECCKVGEVSKEDFAAALRAHQAAVDATKSPQREAAARAEAAGEFG